MLNVQYLALIFSFINLKLNFQKIVKVSVLMKNSVSDFFLKTIIKQPFSVCIRTAFKMNYGN